MPLHISIDVDGTLINHNGDLAPQAKHALETLQAADARLQLWSAGGADYAKATAEKYDLSDMFNSFATKSDLAVDDEPESAHPLATIAVTEDYPLSEAARDIQESLAKCADIALSPPSQQIVAMVQQLQAHTPFGNPAYAGLFPPNCQYHPIPFFGPLEAARVITIGLNPSSGEFASWRLWNSQLSAHDLASRLHNYFRLVRPRPHPWFAPLQEALYVLNCPYKIAAAHVDISPWATEHGPTHLAQRAPALLQKYNELLDQGLQRLSDLTHIFRNARLVLIYRCGGRAIQVKHRLEELLAGDAGPRIEIIPGNENPANWVASQPELRELIGLKNVFE